MLKQWAFPLIHIPIYSLNSDLPLSLGHVILFGWLRLGLGITSRIEDFLFHQRAESISLWYSQSSYSLIKIIIVSGHHIQEIGPWRWRLKTIYAPCCSRGADMVLLATGNGLMMMRCWALCEDRASESSEEDSISLTKVRTASRLTGFLIPIATTKLEI